MKKVKDFVKSDTFTSIVGFSIGAFIGTMGSMIGKMLFMKIFDLFCGFVTRKQIEKSRK